MTLRLLSGLETHNLLWPCSGFHLRKQNALLSLLGCTILTSKGDSL